ncbi:hypothetical protein C8F04DRAFT_1183146 [Mycena alexandri]|uniref:F-box domain-containing protein n=1 Tax=Mycena alexandri TaxID=1745969 RepID=A0AAD6SV40_9AGAR|nr:hypothetical protein C8F04DRAFT_1183146 [Mycena alexandri]
MHLLDLSYDVLLRIFQFLDVASLLRITRVSSAFRRLALSKHVWLAVVSDLRRRHLLNIPPDDSLVHFSTAQLVAEVRRAATGPFTWAADSLGEPIVRRTTHVPMLGPMESTPCEPTLLPGDKQLLVKRGTGCEIWDIAGGRQLWACNSVCREHIAVQPLHSGTQLLLVTWTGEPFRFVDDPAELNCKIVIRLHLLDLTTNTETRIMSVHLPPAFADLSEPLIAGDFWAATAQWFAGGIGWEQGILMVNWKERRCLLLKCDVVHKVRGQPPK